MKTINLIILSAILSCSVLAQEQINNTENSEVQNWKSEIEKTLKIFGHRNWIVIADGAYPYQSNPAIKTILVEESHLEVVEFVNQLIEKYRHLDANIFVDKELTFVQEKDAKGVDAYRTKLNELLEGKLVNKMLHEEIIGELDVSAKMFHVLIIKTDLAIPYTSVFYQLDCGYWNAEAERKLRKEINK